MHESDITITTAHGVVPGAATYLGVLSVPVFHAHPENNLGGTDARAGLEEFDPERNIALLRSRAAAIGADAVIGVQLAMSVLPGGVFAVATGTAIRAK